MGWMEKRYDLTCEDTNDEHNWDDGVHRLTDGPSIAGTTSPGLQLFLSTKRYVLVE